jgi:DNA-binding XRE family transcriptional regulator
MDGQPVPFGVELRRRRVEAGLSLTELAKLVHYSKSHLSKVETGAKAPSQELARQCDAVLSGDGELVESIRPPVPPGVDSTGDDLGEVWVMSLSADGRSEFTNVSRREVLAVGVAGLAGWSVLPARPTQRVGDNTLTSFRSLFDEVRSLGQSINPGALVPVLVTQTHALRVTARHAAPPVRDRALLLAARFAEFTGWMAQEAGDDNRALWWTDRAVELAAAGGDRELGAYALVRRALVALYRQDATTTIALAERAQEIGANPRVRGLAAQREAQGHAMAGDYDRCFRALDRASELLARAAAESTAGPVIGMSTIADPVAIVTGWCLVDLGRPGRAVEILRRELDRVPVGAGRARARFGARLALALAANGDVEEACRAVEPVLDVVSIADSATVRVDLGDLARTLRRWHAHPSVLAVTPRLNAALHTGW